MAVGWMDAPDTPGDWPLAIRAGFEPNCALFGKQNEWLSQIF